MTSAGLDRPPLSAPVSAQPNEPRSAPRRLPLINEYLREQQTLTAVERFAQLHESSELPAQAKYYRTLLPTEKPRANRLAASVQIASRSLASSLIAPAPTPRRPSGRSRARRNCRS